MNKICKRSAALILMLLLAVATFAVPAKPGLKRLLTLTDGTTVTATLVGDEHGHYWLGADGKAYQSTDGNVYQEIDAQVVKQHAAKRRAAANQRRTRRLAPKKVGEVGSITGDKKGIIILVNFKDKSFTATQSDFYKLANQVNYNEGNYKGSMRDYFYAQSDGQFRLTFDVVGPYTVSENCAYYGGNDSDGNDLLPGNMVKEAVQLANSDVNFADYDWDGDGYVDQVYVVYAGKGEADGGDDDTIWPHEWDLSSATGSYITLDGKKINTYACGGEQNGQTGATAGIGTMCHEFSHCLGYPDFYDTDYSGGQGMFEWDLMDSGSYNDDGYRPAGYTSYERWVAGWKTPIELVNTQQVNNMPALQNNGSNAYIIYNKGNNNEYYLLENRQKTGWDTDLPGKGLLILHVDYNASAWSNNTPNDDPSHQRMTWIPADNQYQYTTYQGTKYYTEAGAANDPFPYGNKNSFGKNTTPAATLYNNNSDGTKYLDSSVENITQNSDGTISFLFRGLSNVESPSFSPNGGSYDYGSSVNVTISCGTTGASIYYTTDGSVPTTSSNLYSSALTFNTYTVLKAIAVKDGESSGVTEATYSFNEPIIVADESLNFSTYVGSPQTLPLNVLTENLTQDVTLTLTDPSNVFSLSSTSISNNVEETSVDVIFNPRTVGTFTGTIALSSTGAETVTVSLTATATEAPATNPNTKTFKLVNSASEMVSGMRYIIACGDKSASAGALNSQILGSVETTFNNNITDITGKSVVVYVVEGNQSTGWTFKNESTNQYLYATTTKKLAESSAKNTWTLSGNETGVVMTYGSYGTMLYNVTSPRFTTYTSSPTSTMVQAHLYMEYSEGTAPTSETPVIVADETLSFSTTVGDSQIKSFEVLAESLTENVTVTLTDQNNVFSLGSTTITKSAAEAGATVNVTFTPTTAGTFTGTITLTSSGADPVTVSLSGTAEAAATQTTSEEIDFSAKGYSNELVIESVNGTNCSITFDKGTNNNSPKYYDTGTAIRLYSNNTMTVSSTTKTIVGIDLTFGTGDGSNAITTNVESYSDGTWTGSASSVTFTIGGTNGHRRIKKVTVTYSESGSGGGNNPGTDPGSSSDYYAKARGKKGSALKTAMCGIIYNRTEKSYDYLWTAFQTTDVRSNGKIWDMYSSTTDSYPVSSGSTYKKEGDCYNREHSWPQSWFGSNTPMYTDLHHVYPTDGYVNGMRSNNPYGETNGEKYKSDNDFSKLGTCTYPGYTGKVFEPADQYKGDFARTYFYMVTCYEEKLHDWFTTYDNTEVTAVIDGSTYPAFQTWQLEMLMKWSKNDPVSEKETNRNNAVYAIQNNRNPFIDFPGLEEYIWGSMTATAFDDKNYVQPSVKQNVTMAFSPTTATATIDEDFTEPALTISPSELTVTYSSSDTNVATVDSSTGEVTLVAAGTTTITATFAGNDTYNGNSASYTLTVSASSTPSVQLLYEGVSNYSGEDSSTALTTASTYLDYDNWSSITKVYPGGNAQSNGGCLKFGASGNPGVMTTGNISLTGTGTLTFYLKKYGSDTGKLNVTVTGATADVTEFTPQSDWALCTVNLTNATGAVTITLATSSKRAYVDEITLTSGGTTPVTKQDVTMSFSSATATATIGEDFTEPTLTTTPDNLAVTYSSSVPAVATVDAETGEVTLVAAGTTTITASFAGNGSYNEGSASYELTVYEPSTPVTGSDIYALVTDASTLKDGDQIIIVNSSALKAMSTTQNANNRGATDITIDGDGFITPSNTVQIITLEKDNNNNFYFNVGNNGYLYAASSSKNWLRTETTADDNAKASISISINNSNDATITFQGTNTNNTIRYNPNNGSPIFSCYSSTTGSLPQIYREIPAITIANNGKSNAATLDTYDGQMAKVTLAGRTLWKDGDWNTLCLPFDVTIAGSPLAGADARALSTAAYDGNGTLTLNFTAENAITSLQAGVPYLIKWTNDGSANLTETDLVFNGVTIDNMVRDKECDLNNNRSVTFKGTYNNISFSSDDTNTLFVGSGNNLYYPKDGANIGACRAYFQLTGLYGADLGQQVKDFVLNFGDESTGIKQIGNGQSSSGNTLDAWYTLQGIKLNKKPTKPGVYIYNGRRWVIK